MENNVAQIENASENRIVNRLDLALLYGHNNHENKFEEYSNDETIDKNNVINQNHNIDANIYGFVYIYMYAYIIYKNKLKKILSNKKI